MSPRPQIDHIRRPQLLAAAAEVIAERGFTSTRVADVAERAGTSPAGVLYWFESRDQLLAEALTFAEGLFYDELDTVLAGLDDPRARLFALIERSIGGDDWVLWMEFWARALHDRTLARSRQRLDNRWREQIATIVRDGQRSGVFAGPVPERAALELAALIDGLAVQVALGDSQVSTKVMRVTCVEVAERLLDTELVAPAEELVV